MAEDPSEISAVMQRMSMSAMASNDPLVNNRQIESMLEVLLNAAINKLRCYLDNNTVIETDTSLNTQYFASKNSYSGDVDVRDTLCEIPALTVEYGFNIHAARSSLAEISSAYRSSAKFIDPKLPRLFSEIGRLFKQRFEQSHDCADMDSGVLAFGTALHLTSESDYTFHTCVHEYVVALIGRYKLLGDLSDIDEAIVAVQHAISVSSNDNIHKPLALHNLGTLFKKRFECTGSIKDIEESISIQQLGISLAPHGYAIAAEMSNNLGNSLMDRFKITRDTKDINASVSEFQRAVHITPEADPKMPNFLLHLAQSLRERFESIWDFTDAHLAVSAGEKAVLLTPDHEIDSKAQRLDDLGTTFLGRYPFTESLLDIDQAISAHGKAVDLTREGDILLPRRLSNLGNALLTRSGRTSSAKDADHAIAVCNKAIQHSRDGSPDLANIYNNLGNALLIRFVCDMNYAYIDQAVAAFKSGLDTAPEGNIVFRTRLLLNMGKTLMIQFEYSRDVALTDEAIKMQRKAVELLPEGAPQLPRVFEYLGDSFRSRFEKTHDMADINETVDAYRKAEHAIPRGHPRFKTILRSLGDVLLKRYQVQNNISDLKEAIQVLENAIQQHSSDSPSLAFPLDSLGTAFHHLFKRTRDLADIDKAISAHQRSVDLTSRSDKDLHMRLQGLGIALVARSEHTGNLVDYESAISTNQSALSVTPLGNDNGARHMINIATSLVARFQRTWDINDLDEAVNIQRKALQLLGEGHDDTQSHLYNLAQMLLSRADHTGEMRDLDEAVILSQKALDLTPEEDLLKPSRLSNLGLALRLRFEHTRDPIDIEKSVSLLQKATSMFSATSQSDTICLHYLGLTLLRRFESTGSVNDIVEAIAAHRKSIRSTPDGHSNLLLYFSALAECLHKHFACTGDNSSMDEAISACTKVLDLVPADHEAIPSMRINLGNTYKSKYMRTGNMKDLQASSDQYRLAAIHVNGAPSVKLGAARVWATSCVFFDQSQPLVAYSVCLDLLPQVAWLGYTIDSRHSHLASEETSDLPSEAAAAAIALGGSVEQALEWLEQGRSIVWNQLSNLRSPFELVRDQNSSLSDDLLRVSKALESAGSGKNGVLPLDLDTDQLIAMDEETQRRHKLADEWDDLLAKVREIDGFGNFLRSMKFSQLTSSSPSSGPVIVINVHKIQCDAIILIRGKTNALCVPLSQFSYEKAQLLQKSLGSCVASAGRQSRDVRHVKRTIKGKPSHGLKDILAELWTCIVKPILDALRIQPTDDPSRVWWCATGPLAFLPLHAAGIYTDQDKGSKISDFVISSYTPTVSAVLDDVKIHRQGSKFRGLLAVSQPDTPGQIPLPSTREEIRHIQRSFSEANMQVDCLDGASATVESVTDGMKTHSWVHLACHASQDVKEPIRSAFHLHDGPLELSTIIKEQLPHAEFAFLSACQTGAGDQKLSEEAVHLAAGMLSAGYRSVIATMWSIQDEDAPRVARVVYSHLLEEIKGNNPSYEGAAKALHYATGDLREKLGYSEEALLSWVPYIHVGL